MGPWLYVNIFWVRTSGQFESEQSRKWIIRQYGTFVKKTDSICFSTYSNFRIKIEIVSNPNLHLIGYYDTTNRWHGSVSRRNSNKFIELTLVLLHCPLSCPSVQQNSFCSLFSSITLILSSPLASLFFSNHFLCLALTISLAFRRLLPWLSVYHYHSLCPSLPLRWLAPPIRAANHQRRGTGSWRIP